MLLGLSGGVDSSVVAALLHEAIGDQLVCVFVDTGLLRLNEGDQVMSVVREAPRRERDPRRRREDCSCWARRRRGPRAEAQDHRPAVRRGVRRRGSEDSRRALARAGHDLSRRHRVGRREDRQGAPDQVASQRRRPAGAHEAEAHRAAARSVQRRSAHDRRGARSAAASWSGRHPFPGPGLGVRILGEVKKEYADLLRRADDIFISELRAQGSTTP